ncbi:MAG: choline kinase family protein [Pseudomonadota bacterium]
MTSNEKLIERIEGLPCWSGQISVEPLSGGITNLNFVVTDGGTRYFLRSGADIPVHGVMRFNELAAAKAAAQVGLSPDVVHHEPGLLVTEFIDGKTFAPEDVREAGNLVPMVDLIRRCHREMPHHMRGPVLMFWPFQVVRSYAGFLRDGQSRCLELLPDLLSKAVRLEEAVGPIKVVFGHNDLLAANFIDDGSRLWLIDWDYAGMNSPLFDLANLASNNEFDRDQESALLETYFGGAIPPDVIAAFRAMASASLLRETMWSMVSELHSSLDFDFEAYTAENMARFERAYSEFEGEA